MLKKMNTNRKKQLLKTMEITIQAQETATTCHSNICNPSKYGVTKSRDLDTIAGDRNFELDPDHVIYVVAKYFNTNMGEVYSKKRNLNIVLARQISQYIVHYHLNYNLVQTGQIFNRDHSSVINSIKKFNDIMVTKDPIAFGKIHKIFDKLNIRLRY